MLHIYLYILVAPNWSYFHTGTSVYDLFMDVYISASDEEADIQINLSWIDKEKDRIRTIQLGGESPKDWKGTFNFSSEAQWNVLGGTGLRIESSAKITVLCGLRIPHLTTYFALPLTDYGKEFYLSIFPNMFNNNRRKNNEDLTNRPIWIVGTGHSDSRVAVHNTSGFVLFDSVVPANTLMDISLNLSTYDLSGYKITATTPIFVYNGEKKSNGSFSLQQIPPIKSLGSEYILGPIPGSSEVLTLQLSNECVIRTILTSGRTEFNLGYDSNVNHISIHGSHDIQCNTTSLLDNGNYRVSCDMPLSAGMFLDFKPTNCSSILYLGASKNFLAMFYTQNGISVLSPPLNLRNKNVRFQTITEPNVFHTHLLSIKILTRDYKGVKIDGARLDSFKLSSLQSVSSYSVIQLALSAGAHEVSIEVNSKHRGLTVSLSGYSVNNSGKAYALPLDLTDSHSMGPLPAGNGIMSTNVMIGLLVLAVVLLIAAYTSLTVTATIVRKRRRGQWVSL